MVEARAHEPVILVVDDDPGIVRAIERALSPPGYRVLATTDPYRAIALLGEEQIDVVLSDVDMPALGGHEVLSRARRVRPHAIRCLVTGVEDLEAATRAINECEVYRFISKPFDSHALRDTVAEALSRKRELDRLAQAERRAQVRRALLERIEEECPGLLRAELDEDQTYHLDAEGVRRTAETIGLGRILR